MLWVALSTIFALYDQSSSVTVLNPGNFDKVVKKSPVPVLVEFFAPWCGHCQKLKPIYESVARQAKCIKLAAIDCDEHKSIGGQYGVEGFPTLKIWKTVYNKQGKKKRYSVDYKGDRSESDLSQFIVGQLSDAVKRVYIKNKPKTVDSKEWLVYPLNDFYSTKNDTLTKALFINKDCKVSPTLKCLALEFSKRIDIAVGCEDSLINEFGTGLVVIPSAAVIKKKQVAFSKYDGDFKDYDTLRKWLVQYKSSLKVAKKDHNEEL